MTLIEHGNGEGELLYVSDCEVTMGCFEWKIEKAGMVEWEWSDLIVLSNKHKMLLLCSTPIHCYE